jgi:hypothetical protein
MVDASVVTNDGAGDAAAHNDASPYGIQGGGDVRDGRARVIQLGLAIKEHRAPRRNWRQIQTLNWQAIATTAREGRVEEPPRAAPGSCPADMLLAHGRYLLDAKGQDDTDALVTAQDATCERWRVPGRVCERFSRDKWLAAIEALPRREMRFCIDPYEYPNRAGEYPLTVTTFSESEAYCKREGKRLCTESEWTFACEGEEGVPYPYGYARDAAACPIDRPRIEPEEDTFVPRTTHRTAIGIDAMWQGEPSGAFARCVSPLGVHDMTGNVDEWTRSVRKWGYRMILKGGHWSYVRARCRPQTRGHGPRYVNVETGFRCCTETRAPADAKDREDTK